MYIYTHTNTHTDVYILGYIDPTHRHKHTDLKLPVLINARTFTNTHVHDLGRIGPYIHVHIHMYTYTRTHTRTNVPPRTHVQFRYVFTYVYFRFCPSTFFVLCLLVNHLPRDLPSITTEVTDAGHGRQPETAHHSAPPPRRNDKLPPHYKLSHNHKSPNANHSLPPQIA